MRSDGTERTVNCAWVRTHLDGVLSSAVTPDRAALVKRHLRECSACDREFLDAAAGRILAAAGRTALPPALSWSHMLQSSRAADDWAFTVAADVECCLQARFAQWPTGTAGRPLASDGRHSGLSAAAHPMQASIRPLDGEGDALVATIGAGPDITPGGELLLELRGGTEAPAPTLVLLRVDADDRLCLQFEMPVEVTPRGWFARCRIGGLPAPSAAVTIPWEHCRLYYQRRRE